MWVYLLGDNSDFTKSQIKATANALHVHVNNTPAVTLATLPEDHVTAQTGVLKTVGWTANQTNVSVWTPASGKKFCITDVIISLDAGNSGTVELLDNTTRILKGSFIEYGGLVSNWKKPYLSAAANNVLKITTTSSCKGFLTVYGYEE